MPGGTERARRRDDPSPRREGLAYGLLGIGALTPLIPALVYTVGLLSPKEFDPSSPWQGLAFIGVAALSAIPAGLAAIVLAVIARRLGANALAYLVVACGVLLIAAPFVWFAVATS